MIVLLNYVNYLFYTVGFIGKTKNVFLGSFELKKIPRKCIITVFSAFI